MPGRMLDRAELKERGKKNPYFVVFYFLLLERHIYEPL